MQECFNARFGSSRGLASPPNEFWLCGAELSVKRISAQVAFARVPARSACRRWRAGAFLGENGGLSAEASCAGTKFVGNLEESKDIWKVLGHAAPQHFPFAKDLHDFPGISLIVNELALMPMREACWGP